MTTIKLSLREAVFLEATLKNPEIKEAFRLLVQSYMEVANVSEDEAKRVMFPSWLEGIKMLANKA